MWCFTILDKDISYNSSHIPYVGPFVSIGLGMADAVWGEYLYNWVDANF